jgi:hypothetical protein
MIDYLALLRDEISKKHIPIEPTKPTKHTEAPLSSVLSGPKGGILSKSEWAGDSGSRVPAAYAKAFTELWRVCPAHVDADDWRQARDDARNFLKTWGEQAEALGWSARDLFGLAPVPERPIARYRRLHRYDLTGLCWLLGGRSVIALTEATAAIEHRTGAVTIFRRHNRPALGPVTPSNQRERGRLFTEQDCTVQLNEIA